MIYEGDLVKQRINFIDQVHQEFLSQTGYGAHGRINTYGILTLFEDFLMQSLPEREFIKSAVDAWARSSGSVPKFR